MWHNRKFSCLLLKTLHLAIYQQSCIGGYNQEHVVYFHFFMDSPVFHWRFMSLMHRWLPLSLSKFMGSQRIEARTQAWHEAVVLLQPRFKTCSGTFSSGHITVPPRPKGASRSQAVAYWSGLRFLQTCAVISGESLTEWMQLRGGLCYKVLNLQVGGLEFNPQNPHQKKKKSWEWYCLHVNPVLRLWECEIP